MTVDDFSTPLGQQPVKQRRRLPIAVPHVIAGALGLFFALFVVWVIVGDGSFGGEPTVTVPIDLQAREGRHQARIDGPAASQCWRAGSRPIRQADCCRRAGLEAAGQSGRAGEHQDGHDHRRQDRGAAGGGDSDRPVAAAVMKATQS